MVRGIGGTLCVAGGTRTRHGMSEVSPALLQAVRAHAVEVSCLDAHGARLVTGGGAVLRLWDWQQDTGWALAAEVRAAHRYGVTGVRWSSGGALVASCGVDGALRVWGARRLAARRLLAAGGAAAARALAWAGGRLLAGHDDGAVCVWAVGAARLLARMAPLEGAVHALCAPARNALLLVACTHGVLKVFDMNEVVAGGVEQGAGPTPLLVETCAHDLGALCAAASAHGRLAATGGHDANVLLWAISGKGRSRKVEHAGRLEGHSAAVTALGWARGLLASASLDRTARLWATHPPACLHVLHAHPRYLTCVALAHDLTYLITGSNDRTCRTWALRGLRLEQALAPQCDGLAHFALGDLQGISPLDDDELLEMDAVAEEESAEGGNHAGAQLTWWGRPHAGAVNCLVARGDLLATASSDGLVKVFRCAHGVLEELHTLEAHQYPAQCAAWGGGSGNGNALLLSGGLDGQAVLWDAEAGCRLRTLILPAGAAGAAGDAGGGGVRGAAVSPHRPPLLLLATDDGLAPVWSLAEDDQRPIHVYCAGEAASAAWCCCWAGGGGAAALGDAGGALRVLAPPPPHAVPRQLAIITDAHDLGVTSCQFAPSAEAAGYGAGEAGGAGGAARHVLATAGGDSLVKLWIVDVDEDTVNGSARVQLARRIAAHGGAAATASWGTGRAGGLLASAGADEWARVWSAAAGTCLAAAPARGEAKGDKGSALTAAIQTDEEEDTHVYLALGTLQGHVAVWRLKLEIEEGEGGEEEAALDPRWWGAAGVRQWLLEYVTRVPGREVDSEAEAALLGAARGAGLTGARLVDDPLTELMQAIGFEPRDSDDEESEELALASEEEDEPPRTRLRRELRWLRRAPPHPSLEDCAPHSLRCPLSHRLLSVPARAADGLSYERAAAHEWFLAAEGAVSAISGRRLRSARLLPNHGLRRELRRFLRTGSPDRPDRPDQPDPTDETEPTDQPEHPEEADGIVDADTADLLGLDDED